MNMCIAIVAYAAGVAAAACTCAIPICVQASRPLPAPTAPPDPCAGPDRLLATLDRPTVGYSACAVRPGAALFEIGYQNELIGSARSRQVQTQYPQNFLRIGIAPRFELDVIGPGDVRERTLQPGTPDLVTNGSFDSGLGFKYECAPRGKTIFAIDGLYTSPSGAPAFTAGNASYTANLDIQYALGPSTGIGTTLAMSSTGGYAANGTHMRYGVFSPTVALTQSLRNHYQPYFEYVYDSRLSPSIGGRAFIDYGLQKLLGRDTEVDVELGHALTANPTLQLNYVGVGFGIQIR